MGRLKIAARQSVGARPAGKSAKQGAVANRHAIRRALLGTTFFVGSITAIAPLSVATLSAALLAPMTNALAADGDGGAGAPPVGGGGGAGASGFTGTGGNPGGNSASFASGGGGGGGSGTTTGGSGGVGGVTFGAGGTSGAGGVGAGASGSTGGNDSPNAADGGGGGGGGVAGNGATGTITGNVTGGNGGNGGTGGGGSGGACAQCSGAGGGGGGGAGYGAVVNSNVTNTFTVIGGVGGTGGAGGPAFGAGFAAGNGGNGGAGGVGVQLVNPATTFTNSGTITGGNGGAGGAAGAANGGVAASAGAGGSGGAGIVGSGVAITNSGSIAGGLANAGAGAQANAITFTGGTNSLTLQAGSTITGNVVAFSTADTFALGGTTNSSFNASLIGPAAQYRGFGVFNKTGTSTWTLTGAPNTATPWVISAGTLAAGASTNVFGSTGAITVTSPGTLDIAGFNQTIGSLTGSGTATNSGGAAALTTGNATSTTFSGAITGANMSLTLQGTGTFTLSGTNTYGGVTTINSGTLALSGTGSIANSSQVNLANAAATFDVSASTTVGGPTITTLNGVASSHVTLGANTLTIANGSTSYAGIIQGTGGLTLTAGTQTLSGANTYTGVTTINGGTLALSGTGSIASSSQVNLANAAATFDISASTTVGGPTITTLNGVASSHVTLGANTLTIANGSTTYAGIIQGTGGLTLTAGTQTLTGTNTYTGVTTINGGTLVVSGAAGSIANSSQVNLANAAATLDVSASTIAGGPTITTLNGVANSHVTLGANTLTISNGSTTYAGIIQGTGGLTLTAGTQTLSGTNTYTGVTTINGGTLALSGASGSIASSSQVNLANAAATFDISASTTVGGPTITTLNGVANSHVTLGANTLTISNGSTTYAGIIQGTGGLTLTAGTETLTGTNTYSGTTTINAATLALTGTGSIANSIVNVNNAAGVFDISGTTAGASIVSLNGVANSHVTLGAQTLTISNGSTTYAGIIQGTGGVTLTAGTQTLSGTNTYTGVTTINGGTLALSGTGSIATSSQVNVANAAGTFSISATTAGATIVTLSGVGSSHVTLGTQTLTLSNASGTYGGIIQGSGALVLTAGTETLTGTNTYTGVTVINGATLKLAGSGSIAASSQVQLAAAAAIFDISGTSGATITTLNGVANSHVTLGAQTLTISNASTTYAGVIQGTGGLAITGGTETLSGINTYTGATSVAAGAGLTIATGGSIGTGFADETSLLTNNGTVTVNGALWAANVNNNGTLVNNGTVHDTLNNTGSVTNNAAYFANVNNTGAAAVINNTASGTWTGNLLSNTGGAIVNNAGTWNGDANNASTVNNTGTWTTASAGFTNSGTVNLTGGTINATAGGLFNSGMFNVSGTPSVIGAYNNQAGGVVVLASTSSTLTTTTFNANGGTITVPYNLTATTGQAGQVKSTNNSGSTVVNFVNTAPGTPVVLGPNTPVIVNSGSGTLTATAGSGLPPSFGLVNVQLVSEGNGNWDLQRTANTGAIGAPAGSIIAAITAFDTSFHQVSSAFVASPQSVDPNKWTGGMWSRGAAGQVTAKSTVTDSLGSAPTALKVKTNFDAYQVGADAGLLNAGNTGWNIHFGAMAGSVGANSSEQLGSGTTLKFDVPFAGLYGVFTHGAFFSDVTVRHDWHKDNVTNTAAFLNNAPLSGEANAVNASAGYHVDLPMVAQGFFLEPSVGFGLTKTNLNALPTNVNETGFAPGLISFQTITSEVARAGLRVGTSATIRDVLGVQPFATISVWREMAGMAQEQFSQLGTSTVDSLGLTRTGTFYQVGAGIGAQVLHTGVLAFVRGDMRFGENLDGASVVAGGRYTFGP